MAGMNSANAEKVGTWLTFGEKNMKMILAVMTLFSFLLQHRCFSWDITMPIEDGSTNAPVIAVFTDPGFAPWADMGLIVSIWEDGKVLWSEDDLRGLGKYQTSTIPPEKIDILLSIFEAQGLYTNRVLQEEGKVVVDGPYTTISIFKNGHGFTASSSHEILESYSNTVVASYGARSLDGLDIEEFIQTEPVRWRDFRAKWKSIRDEIRDITPKTGRPMEEYRFHVAIVGDL